MHSHIYYDPRVLRMTVGVGMLRDDKKPKRFQRQRVILREPEGRVEVFVVEA